MEIDFNVERNINILAVLLTRAEPPLLQGVNCTFCHAVWKTLDDMNYIDGVITLNHCLENHCAISQFCAACFLRILWLNSRQDRWWSDFHCQSVRHWRC